jgi:hypothetical protein
MSYITSKAFGRARIELELVGTTWHRGVGEQCVRGREGRYDCDEYLSKGAHEP